MMTKISRDGDIGGDHDNDGNNQHCGRGVMITAAVAGMVMMMMMKIMIIATISMMLVVMMTATVEMMAM